TARGEESAGQDRNEGHEDRPDRHVLRNLPRRTGTREPITHRRLITCVPRHASTLSDSPGILRTRIEGVPHHWGQMSRSECAQVSRTRQEAGDRPPGAWAGSTSGEPDVVGAGHGEPHGRWPAVGGDV